MCARRNSSATATLASHEFSVQLRAFDSAKSGSAVRRWCASRALLIVAPEEASGGLAITGGLNLGGSIETIFNPVAVVEVAIEKGAASILMPISSRRQLNDLPDDLAAKITIHLLSRCPRCVAEGVGLTSAPLRYDH